jgi:hypothetical protein
MPDIKPQEPVLSADAVAALVALSSQIWGIQRYWQTASGPKNLELSETPEQILARVALLVDRTLATVLPPTICAQTAPLRRASNYVATSYV